MGDENGDGSGEGENPGGLDSRSFFSWETWLQRGSGPEGYRNGDGRTTQASLEFGDGARD